MLYAAHRAARTERGFCMNLDGALRGRYPGIKLAIARDRCGRVVAFHRYTTADAGLKSASTHHSGGRIPQRCRRAA